MADDLLHTLHAHFGFEAFRPGQQQAIESLLAGQHTLVVMPTGAGKSLVYQLTALHRSGVTLVISPLIALMKDQVDSLTRRKVSAAFINSALSASEQSQRMRAMAEGAYRLVYVAPERLRSAAFMQAVQRATIALLAVDEAHCLSHWGHDFRPDYLHIAAARQQMGNPLVAALTATATPKVQDDIVQLLQLPGAQRVVTGFNRPNLSFEVRYTTEAAAKLRDLQALLGEINEGAAIVYAGTRRDAEEAAEFVRTMCQRPVEYYHAGLPAPERTRIQDAFMARKLPVVVATNAFGMGIDRADVRLVAHFNMPGTLEAYYQEAGRAGRDGDPARAVLLYDPQDRALQEWFIENDAPSAQELRALYQALQKPGRKEFLMPYADLALHTSMHEVKLKLGLAQLEMAGMLQRLGDAGPGMLLRLGQWNEKAMQATAATTVQRRRHRYKQLREMVDYAETNRCRRRILLDHFGDRAPIEAERCCDNCLAQQRAVSSARREDFSRLSFAEQTALIMLDAVRRLKWEAGKEKLAQMLKGSHAKGMQQFGYNKSPYYGRLASFQVREIEDFLAQLIELKYFKVVGGGRPVLRLTPAGETAIQARAKIALNVPRRLQEGSASEDEQQRSKPALPSPTDSTAREKIHRVVALGEAAVQEGVPELIAALQDSDGNVRRLAASALGKIKDRQSVAPLLALLEKETLPQVRQYAVKALGRIGDVGAQEMLEKIAEDFAERDYTQTAARLALNRLRREQKEARESWSENVGDDNLPQNSYHVSSSQTEMKSGRTQDAASAFLSRPHPRPLVGNWDAGWALGFHSSFAGANWRRSTIGELTYRFKYQNDLAALPEIITHTLALCAAQPDLIAVDALAPVPPSTPRPHDPVRLWAEALGEKLQLPVWPVFVRTRQIAQQKEMRNLQKKRANVAGAFATQREVKGKRVLVLDDLFDSGATLAEITRVLREAGATKVNLLALTRTIHADA